MDRTPPKWTWVLLLLAAAWLPGAARACSCVPPDTAVQERERSAVVFLGTVEKIAPARDASAGNWFRAAFGWLLGLFGAAPDVQHDPNLLHVTFDVAESFKGGAGGRFRVVTHAHGPTCGYGFQAGGAYLVYASGDPELPTVSLCSRTTPVGQAEDDLAILRGG